MFRKILMGIVLFSLCFSGFVFADSAYPGADQLKEYGLIRGDSDGNLNVEGSLLRSHACVLLAQMYGRMEEAEKQPFDPVFSDVREKDWFAPYVLYAYRQKWIKGYDDGTFRADRPVSVQMWAMMLMNALNYDTAWVNAVGDLEKKGIKIYAADPLALKRGEAFDAMWKAVNTPRKDESVSLLEKLGKLQSPDIRIERVNIPSVRYIEIFVDRPLEKERAEKTENYVLLTEDEKEAKIEYVEYDETAKKIGIYLSEDLKTGSRLSLVQADVTSGEKGVLLPDAFQNIPVADNQPPKILRAESKGTRVLEVKFSEPIKGKDGKLERSGDFLFDKTLSVREITLSEHDTLARIIFNTSTVGPLKLYPQKSICDYYGHSLIAEGDWTVVMSADPAPMKVAKVISASPTEIVAEMTKGVMNAKNDPSYIVSGSKHSDGFPEVNDKIVRIKFTKNYLHVGENTIKIKSGTFYDYSGYYNHEIQFEAVAEGDEEIPYAEGVVFDAQDRFKLKFSEPLNAIGSKLQSKQNYKLLKGEEDVSHLIVSILYDSATYSVIFKTREPLMGDYRLEVVEVSDLSGNLFTGDYDFNVGDVMPPAPEKWRAKILNRGTLDQKLILRFDEEMSLSGRTSVLDPGNYMMGKIQLSHFNPSVLKIETLGNASVVQISYPGAKFGGVDFGTGETASLIVGAVADKHGNAVAGFANYVDLSKEFGMAIETAELVDSKELKLKINDEIDAFDPEDLIIEAGGKRVRGAYTLEVEDGKSVILVEFEASLASPVRVRTAKGKSENVYGDRFLRTESIEVADRIGPVLEQKDGQDDVTYEKKTGTVIMVFSENLDPDVVSKLTFDMPGIRIRKIEAKDREIRISVDSSDREKVVIDQAIVQQNQIWDLRGNATVDLVTKVRFVK